MAIENILAYQISKARKDWYLQNQVWLLYQMLPKSIQKEVDIEKPFYMIYEEWFSAFTDEKRYKIRGINYEQLYNTILEKIGKFGKTEKRGHLI